MKIYYEHQHYDSNKRGQLFPLLKAFIKHPDFSDNERMAMYQISKKEMEFVKTPQDADICILTMSWNYYLTHDRYEQAKTYIETCNNADKQVWSWMSGDFGVKLDIKGDYLVFRHSGHGSKLDKRHQGMPTFIGDPYRNYFNTDELQLPEHKGRTVVGFCGQADATITKTLKELGIRLRHKLMFSLGKTLNEPQPVRSTSRMRAQLLNLLEKSENIESNFIKRKQYRAGVKENRSKHKSSLEFYQNIKDSHYVLCVRGGGNFSVRFYETLAMGRIPIFVNTDCLLPLADEINWKKHCVWVEAAKKNHIAEKVQQFHQQHTQESLFELMRSNRRLWENKLRIGSFFKSYFNAV